VTRQVSLAETLGRALDAMRDRAPSMYRALSAQLHIAATRLSVDDETVPLRSDGASIALDDGRAPFSVHVRSDRGTLLDVAAGRVDLVSAVLGDRLFVSGDVASLVALERAAALFVSWATCSPAAWPLFHRYRDDEGER